MDYTGELIALTAVLCWTLSAQLFGAAAKQVGSVPVNIIRISSALVFFGAYLFFTTGQILPPGFPLRSWIILSLSGVAGFFLGDICLFKAIVSLGPRIALLLFSLSAPAAALMGWGFLSETYLPLQWAGMAVTLTGVCLVIFEKDTDPAGSRARGMKMQGILFGLGAMLGQAGGYVMSKMGMQTPQGFLDPFAATQVRALAAFACSALLFSLTRQWGRVRTAILDRRALGFTLTGAVLGPFLGVSLSLFALHYLTTGVASTYLSLTPVCILPFALFIHREKVSVRAVAGAVIAVAGIWLLMNTSGPGA